MARSSLVTAITSFAACCPRYTQQQYSDDETETGVTGSDAFTTAPPTSRAGELVGTLATAPEGGYFQKRRFRVKSRVSTASAPSRLAEQSLAVCGMMQPAKTDGRRLRKDTINWRSQFRRQVEGTTRLRAFAKEAALMKQQLEEKQRRDRLASRTKVLVQDPTQEWRRRKPAKVRAR